MERKWLARLRSYKALLRAIVEGSTRIKVIDHDGQAQEATWKHLEQWVPRGNVEERQTPKTRLRTARTRFRAFVSGSPSASRHLNSGIPVNPERFMVRDYGRSVTDEILPSRKCSPPREIEEIPIDPPFLRRTRRKKIST
ncbi:hypothetical protein KM043_004147 [Ampulex compressa]|nr:hypothetical protein KM043_004147 [Ampulex compressa]